MNKPRLRMSSLAFASLLLVSCTASPQDIGGGKRGANSTGDELLTKAIERLRQGFCLDGTRVQKVTDMDGTDLYQNTYTYDYEFENDDDGIRTKQSYSYPYAGKTYNSTVTAVRDSNGYAANEYVNYKNEIDTYPILDSDGNYAYYDEYFINPFLIVEDGDFLHTDESLTFSLDENKLDIFNYYLCGNSVPLTSLSITLASDGESATIHEESVSFTGRTKDETTGYYKRCKWTYVGDFRIYDMGETIIDSPELGKKTANEGLSSILNSIGDNFTLSKVLYNVQTGEEAGDVSVSYFDGDAYYVKPDSSDDTKVNDYLYSKDPFLTDGLLYEYRYDSSSRLWLKSSNDSSSSFNIQPRSKDIFIPHLKDIDVSLFSTAADSNGYYSCNNTSAIAFMGMGFLSDAETLSYFSSGYGTGARIGKDGDDVVCLVSFYYTDGTNYYEVGYKMTYSNIGSTTLPEYDL